MRDTTPAGLTGQPAGLAHRCWARIEQCPFASRVGSLLPVSVFRKQPPEFWALVKLVSHKLKYSERGTKRVKRYTADDAVAALRDRGLDPSGHRKQIELLVRYVDKRADLLEDVVEPNLLDRKGAARLFKELRAEIRPPKHLLSMNKQKGPKRHYAYLSCIVNMLTWHHLTERFGAAEFAHGPHEPLTFSRKGMPLRTLFRWMDGAYPGLNQPHAAWEVKEFYGTTSFGSRVADAVYEAALDGYELNDLRAEGVDVKHYLFVDAREWWDKGKPYLCRIVDMLHADLLDGAFFGREAVDEWPKIVKSWPEASESPGQ